MKMAKAVPLGLMIAVILANAWACRQGSPGPIVEVGDSRASQNSSSLTAVNIALPDRAALKEKVPDIETLMDAWHLVVTPSSDACESPTNIDVIQDYIQDAKLEANLKQGCGYQIKLELGKKIIDTGEGVAEVTFESAVNSLVEKNCATSGCHNGAVPPKLTNFTEVSSQKDRVFVRAVELKTMPKAAALSEEEIAIMNKWKEGGFIEKAAKEALNKPDPDHELQAVYYVNQDVLAITKEDIAGKDLFEAPLKLQLQESGRKIGLGNKQAEVGSAKTK